MKFEVCQTNFWAHFLTHACYYEIIKERNCLFEICKAKKELEIKKFSNNKRAYYGTKGQKHLDDYL